MSDVKLLTVSADEGEQRLDRWMKRRFPQLSQGHIEKMCRTGQIRVDSGRAKASDRGDTGAGHPRAAVARYRSAKPPAGRRGFGGGY